MTNNPLIRYNSFFTSMNLIRSSLFSTYNGYIALNKNVIVFPHCRVFWYPSGDVLATDPYRDKACETARCMPGAVSQPNHCFMGSLARFLGHLRDSAIFKDI